MTLLKILFWLAVALDAGAIGLFFILGLAFAPSSKTSPISVAFLMLVVPGLILAALAFGFTRAQSFSLKLCAFALVASPILIVLIGQITTGAWMLTHPEEAKIPTSFKPVSLAKLEAAVLANDPAGVTKAASEANIRGNPETATAVLLSLYRLEKSPEHLPVLKALLAAGANPNAGDGEPPLEIAIRGSHSAGPAPIGLLLDAGAKPNAFNAIGVPISFAATANNVDLEILGLLLDRGADLNTKSVRGESILTHAAAEQNWKAVLYLLKRGANPNTGQSPEGKSFREMVETSARIFGERGDLAEILRQVRTP